MRVLGVNIDGHNSAVGAAEELRVRRILQGEQANETFLDDFLLIKVIWKIYFIKEILVKIVSIIFEFSNQIFLRFTLKTESPKKPDCTFTFLKKLLMLISVL